MVMVELQNLHTHTSYCDGADTPEEIILTAIDKGFTSIGFSGHAYMHYSPYFIKKGDHTEEYKRVVRELKEKYKDQIRIYLGLEVDMYAGCDMKGYDYLIGSVHFLKCGDEYVAFERSDSVVEDVIRTHFGGNGMEYAKACYRSLAQLPQYGKFDIVGHFDSVSKHCETRDFFDVESKEYLNSAIEAAEALAGKIPFFEVNTGAMARGNRNSPYPSLTIIKELKRLGFGAVITSDCHDMTKLDYKFDEAAELLRAGGYKEKYILTDSGFSAVSL